MPRTYWVYILASRTRRLYIGVTGNLPHRIAQHRVEPGGGAFATAYRCERLVYAEPFAQVEDAIRREKALKGWRRERKVALVSEGNPAWEELMPFERADGGRERARSEPAWCKRR